ncbi:MAG: hypothetical protein H7061_08845 [Bdellovibrionaceae bacterium]|nr:hypothetical protein [Bdellovibrio sp.]
MKTFLISILLLISANSNAQSFTTNKLIMGCGLADEVYSYLNATLTEKPMMQFSLKSKGVETTRILKFYADESWFLTLEFFSNDDVADDVTCIVSKGPGKTSQAALDYVLVDYPAWHWGAPPVSWPR